MEKFSSQLTKSGEISWSDGPERLLFLRHFNVKRMLISHGGRTVRQNISKDSLLSNMGQPDSTCSDNEDVNIFTVRNTTIYIILFVAGYGASTTTTSIFTSLSQNYSTNNWISCRTVLLLLHCIALRLHVSSHKTVERERWWRKQSTPKK